MMAEAHGYAPPETDRLTLRDLAAMLWGAVEKQRGAWQRAAMVSAMVYNGGGPRAKTFRPKSPKELYPTFFGESPAAARSWEDEVRAQFAAYNSTASGAEEE